MSHKQILCKNKKKLLGMCLEVRGLRLRLKHVNKVVYQHFCKFKSWQFVTVQWIVEHIDQTSLITAKSALLSKTILNQETVLT